MSVNAAVMELFSANVLANYQKSLHFKDATNRNYEGEIKGKGSVLRILSLPRPTRNSTTIGTVTYERLRPAAQNFTIDQDVYWAIQEDELEAQLSSIPLMQDFSKEGAYVLADGVDQFLALLMARVAATSLTGTQVGNGALDDRAYDVIVRLGEQLDTYLVPKDERHVFVPFWFMTMLRLDARMTGYGTSDSRKVIRGEVVDKVEGFMVHPVSSVPGATDTAIATQTATSATIIAAQGGGITYAEHIPPEGLIQSFSSAQNPSSFDNLMRARNVFGAAGVHPEAITKIVVTKGSTS